MRPLEQYGALPKPVAVFVDSYGRIIPGVMTARYLHANSVEVVSIIGSDGGIYDNTIANEGITWCRADDEQAVAAFRAQHALAAPVDRNTAKKMTFAMTYGAGPNVMKDLLAANYTDHARRR